MPNEQTFTLNGYSLPEFSICDVSVDIGEFMFGSYLVEVNLTAYIPLDVSFTPLLHLEPNESITLVNQTVTGFLPLVGTVESNEEGEGTGEDNAGMEYRVIQAYFYALVEEDS